MIRDTTLEIVPEIEASSRRSQIRKYIMLTLLNIPQVMRKMNSIGEDKDQTLIHFNIWIRTNEIRDTQNQYTGSQNQ